MDRHTQIRLGLIWQITPQTPITEPMSETVLFEGSRAACVKWMRERGVYRHWKAGKSGLSLGRLIWEAEDSGK